MCIYVIDLVSEQFDISEAFSLMMDCVGHTPLYDAVRAKQGDAAKLLRDGGAHFSEEEVDEIAGKLLKYATNPRQNICTASY